MKLTLKWSSDHSISASRILPVTLYGNRLTVFLTRNFNTNAEIRTFSRFLFTSKFAILLNSVASAYNVHIFKIRNSILNETFNKFKLICNVFKYISAVSFNKNWVTGNWKLFWTSFLLHIWCVKKNVKSINN